MWLVLALDAKGSLATAWPGGPLGTRQPTIAKEYG